MASTTSLASASSTTMKKSDVAMIVGGVMVGIGLVKLFQGKRRFSGHVFVTPELRHFFNLKEAQTIIFTILPRSKPVGNSPRKTSIGNKFHGSLAVKAEVFADDKPTEPTKLVKLVDTMIFDIELILSGQTWQVVMAPISNSPTSSALLIALSTLSVRESGQLNDVKIPVKSDDSSKIILDWSRGKKLSSTAWKLEDFVKVAYSVAQRQGNYCTFTNNCLHFRNSVYREICIADQYLK